MKPSEIRARKVIEANANVWAGEFERTLKARTFGVVRVTVGMPRWNTAVLRVRCPIELDLPSRYAGYEVARVP